VTGISRQKPLIQKDLQGQFLSWVGHGEYCAINYEGMRAALSRAFSYLLLFLASSQCMRGCPEPNSKSHRRTAPQSCFRFIVTNGDPGYRLRSCSPGL
jgi:hypothetical protein